MRTASRALAVAGAATLAVTLAVATGIGGQVTGAVPGPTADADPAALAAPAQDASAAELALLAPELERDAGAAPGALRQRLIRAGGRNLVHAEIVLDRGGTLVTFHVDRGTVTGVSSNSISIAQAGGGSRSVATTDATRVRKDRERSALPDLAKGDVVVVLSKVENGKATATFVLVPVEKPASSSGSGPAASPVPQPQG